MSMTSYERFVEETFICNGFFVHVELSIEAGIVGRFEKVGHVFQFVLDSLNVISGTDRQNFACAFLQQFVMDHSTETFECSMEDCFDHSAGEGHTMPLVRHADILYMLPGVRTFQLVVLRRFW